MVCRPERRREAPCSANAAAQASAAKRGHIRALLPLLGLLWLLLGALGSGGPAAHAQPAPKLQAGELRPAPPRPLSGDYQLGPATLIDPPPGEPQDALLRLHLTGRSAADLYRALPGKPRRDECLDDGSLAKTQGEVFCLRSPRGEHECWLGIDLKHSKLAPAFVC